MGVLMRNLAMLGSLALAPLLLLACAATEPSAEPQAREVATAKPGPRTAKPVVETPPPAPEPTARAVIASVQMLQDCPAAFSAVRPAPREPRPSDEEAGISQGSAAKIMPAGGAGRGSSLSGRGGPSQPCTQSTMQVVFSGQGDRTSRVEIREVRMLHPESGETLAKLTAREPAAWADGAYQSWNETIGPHQAVKASYALSVPDWSVVDRALGSSFGVMFVLEVDLKIGDESQTVRSAEFPREQPHMIST